MFKRSCWAAIFILVAFLFQLTVGQDESLFDSDETSTGTEETTEFDLDETGTEGEEETTEFDLDETGTEGEETTEFDLDEAGTEEKAAEVDLDGIGIEDEENEEFDLDEIGTEPEETSKTAEDTDEVIEIEDETPVEETVQEIDQVKGIVKNSETNQPVPNVTVKVVDQDGETKTDFDGRFTVDVIRTALSPDLVVEDLNYRIKYITLQESDFIQNMEILIEPISSDLQELDKITVTEQEATPTKIMKPSEAMSQVALNPESVDKLPSAGEADISRTLQLLPGISGSNESSAGLYVRGGTPDQNLILMDGFTIYNIDHFFGFFSVFHTDAIDQVLMTKGGFPAIYGGRASSVMEITSKTADFEKFSAGAGVGFLSADLSIEIPLFGKGSIMIAARRTYTDFIQSNVYRNIFGFFSDLTDTSVTGTNFTSVKTFSGREPVFHFFDVNNKIVFCPTEKDSISFNLYGGSDILVNSGDDVRIFERMRRRNSGTDIFQNKRINKIEHDETKWGNIGMSLIWNRNWAEKYKSNLTVAYSKYHSDTEYEMERDTSYSTSYTIPRPPIQLMASSFVPQQQPDPVQQQQRRTEVYRHELQNNDVYDLSVKLDNHIPITENNLLTFGGQVKAIKTNCTDTVTATTIGGGFMNQPLDTLEEISAPFNWEDTGMVFTGYLQDQWTLVDKVTLFPGIRLNYYDGTHNFYVEPRVSVQWKIIDELKVKAGWGMFSQFVNRVTLDDIMRGSSDMWFIAYDLETPVKPKRPVIEASHFIGGVTFSNSFLLVDIEAYYKRMEGLTMVSLRNFSVLNTFFQGSGEAMGIEFLVQKNVGQHTGWVSYTLSQVLHTFPELNEGKPFAAPHDKTHELKFVYNFAWKGLNASAVWIYATGSPYTEAKYRYYQQIHTGEWNEAVLTNGYNRARIPNYHRLDLSVAYDFTIREKNELSVGLSLFNLYNKENIWERNYEDLDGNMIQVDKKYLGITPSLFFNYNFK